MKLFDGWLVTAVYPDGAVFAWNYSPDQFSGLRDCVSSLLNTDGVYDVHVQKLGPDGE